MAFDGVVIANIVYDMNRLLTGGRIYKIYQPEADELLLVVKNQWLAWWFSLPLRCCSK